MTTPGAEPPWRSFSGSDQARLRTDKVRVASLVARLSQEHGIRTLAAGGPIFAPLGLVSPRVSPTAVVIVEPIHQLHLVLALEGIGWTRGPIPNAGRLLPPVFTRVVHPDLVCPLDIYDFFPGFYAPPAEVFEHLWSSRTELRIGQGLIPALDRVAVMLVAGHDQLGALAQNQRSTANIEYFVSMFRSSLSPEEQRSVVRLISAVRGIEPLRLFLEAIGEPAGEITIPSPVYCQLRLCLDHVSDPILFAVALFESPPGRRFRAFASVFRRHPARVVRALLAAPRSFVVVLGSRARHRRQQQPRPLAP